MGTGLARVQGLAFPGTLWTLHGTQLTIHCAPASRWLLNLFHSQIESKFRRVLESKVRMSKQIGVRQATQGLVQVLTDLWPWTAMGSGSRLREDK